MNKPQYLIDAEIMHETVYHDMNATGAQILEAEDALEDALIAAAADGYTPEND